MNLVLLALSSTKKIYRLSEIPENAYYRYVLFNLGVGRGLDTPTYCHTKSDRTFNSRNMSINPKILAVLCNEKGDPLDA